MCDVGKATFVHAKAAQAMLLILGEGERMEHSGEQLRKNIGLVVRRRSVGQVEQVDTSVGKWCGFRRTSQVGSVLRADRNLLWIWNTHCRALGLRAGLSGISWWLENELKDEE